MATMSASSREAMILGYKKDRYRLPTVREAASMMSFPIDYWFYGDSKATKHTLVGNAVPPKMSYAIARAIVEENYGTLPTAYPRIKHSEEIKFVNLNGIHFPIKEETPRRATAKFKYHIPYLIINAYRVELTNYHSDFDNLNFKWDVEIHYSQGKDKAKMYCPILPIFCIPEEYHSNMQRFLEENRKRIPDADTFQSAYCMTTKERNQTPWTGPYEILELTKAFIEKLLPEDSQRELIIIDQEPHSLPLAIAIGYYLLSNLFA